MVGGIAHLLALFFMITEYIPHAVEPKEAPEQIGDELIRLRSENADIMRRWDSDRRIFCGALHLLKEAGLAPGSVDLVAAAARFDLANAGDVARAGDGLPPKEKNNL